MFVFPSRTDTFGMVLLEAMASGLPVAALPVCGPQDVVRNGVTGVLSHDLRAAALAALSLDRTNVRAKAAEYSWENAARLFLANITGACLNGPARARASRPQAGGDQAVAATAGARLTFQDFPAGRSLPALV